LKNSGRRNEKDRMETLTLNFPPTALTIVSWIVFSTAACSQTQKTDFPVLKGPSLGQKPPGSTPEIFVPGVISTEKGWEAAMSF
jgi:hypothetical protein